MLDTIFQFTISNRQKIIYLFKLFYLTLIVLLIIGGREVYLQTVNFPSLYSLAINFGKAAIIFYILTTIPGIARRFGIKHKLISILMIFRRYIGIAMFLFVLIHFMFIAGINAFFRGVIPQPVLFIFMGTLAFYLLIPMFLTSNDFSSKKLGRWWSRVHKLTYVIMFFIFLHVALQRLSMWSGLMGITVILQISSHVYGRMKK